MKVTPTQSTPATPFDLQAPLALVSEHGRQQMAVALESACAMFRGFEAIRKIQERAAHQALQSHTDAADKLKKSNAPDDLMKVQANLLRANLDGASRYWQQLAQVATEMQAEIANCGSHLIQSDTLLEAAAGHLPGADLMNGLLHGEHVNASGNASTRKTPRASRTRASS